MFLALVLLCRPIAVPLGNLSRGQVSKGYSILCEIQDLLNEEKAANDDTEGAPATGGGASGEDEGIAAERRKSKIKALSTSFYTTIPHVFPEGSPPSYIDSSDELRKKTDLIQSLEQMQDSANTTSELDESAGPKVDEQYKSMNCPLKSVPHDSEEWRMIADYIKHGQVRLQLHCLRQQFNRVHIHTYVSRETCDPSSSCDVNVKCLRVSSALPWATRWGRTRQLS